LERERRQKVQEEERIRKEEERAKREASRAEQRRSMREETRRTKELVASKKKGGMEGGQRGSTASSSSGGAGEDDNVRTAPMNRPSSSLGGQSDHSIQPLALEEATSPRGERVRVWIRRQFSRRHHRHGSTTEDETMKGRRKSLLGSLSFGRGLGRLRTRSSTSLDSIGASIREVALAGRENKRRQMTADGRPDSGFGHGRQASGVLEQGSVSSLGSDSSFVGPSRRVVSAPTPPLEIRNSIVVKSASPTRDSRFKEMVD
jgi:hypothetical protein